MRPFFLLLLAVLLLFQCRTTTDLTAPEQFPLISAHRGGRNIAGYPENALPTFAWTVERVPDAWVECDISMSADSVLFLLHDSSLDRTTTGSGKVSQTRWDVIDDLYLKDDFGTVTDFEVPTLEEALNWARKTGTTFTLDVKRGVPFERVVAAVQQAGLVEEMVVITYNAADARTVYELEPRLRLSVTIRNEEELTSMLATGIPVANWIAFTGTRLAPESLFAKLDALGVPAIVGTLGNIDQSAAARGPQVYYECLERGGDVLATDRPVEAHQAVETFLQLQEVTTESP